MPDVNASNQKSRQYRFVKGSIICVRIDLFARDDVL